MDTKRTKIISIVFAVAIVLLIGLDVYENYSSINNYERPPRVYDPGIIRNDFVRNEIIISFNDNYSVLQIEDFLRNLDNFESYDTINGKEYVVVFTKDFDSRAEILNYCNKLSMNNSNIKYCEPNDIIMLDDCSKGPC